MTEPRVSAGLPRGVLIMVGLAAITITVAGLNAISEIIGPAFLALTLTISAIPISDMLVRRGLPRWVGTTIAILTVYLGVLLLAVSLVVAGARFADLVPQYQEELVDLLVNVREMLSDLGVQSEQIESLLASFDLNRVAAFITSLLGNVWGLLTNLGFVLALVFFIAVDSTSFAVHLEASRPDRAGFVEAMHTFSSRTRQYFVISTVFGLIVAVIDTTFLLIVGVPGAVLWGLLAFITNYVPNIGFLLGLIPPAVLALLDGGPGLLIAVLIVYSVINVVIQSIIQPKLVGDAVGMSASVTFLSLVIWAWIIGPLGAILAVPLSLLVKALFIDVDPHTRWLGGLVGDESGGASDLDQPAS